MTANFRRNSDTDTVTCGASIGWRCYCRSKSKSQSQIHALPKSFHSLSHPFFDKLHSRRPSTCRRLKQDASILELQRGKEHCFRHSTILELIATRYQLRGQAHPHQKSSSSCAEKLTPMTSTISGCGVASGVCVTIAVRKKSSS